MPRKKLNLNRKKFIKWCSLRCFLEDNRLQIVDDLVKSGEYIITAEDLLNNIQFSIIPTTLLEGYTGDKKYVNSTDCKLIYIQEDYGNK